MMQKQTPSQTVRGQEGFTVMESLVALIVLSLGFLAIGAMIPTLKTDLTTSSSRSRATFLAEQWVEDLRAMSYSDSLLVPGTHRDTQSRPGYELSWTVEDDQPRASIKRITVTVNRPGDHRDHARVVFLHAEAGR